MELEHRLNTSIHEMQQEHSKMKEKHQKLAALNLEVKITKQSICDIEDRCNKLESLFGNMDKRFHILQQQLADFENHLANIQRVTSILNTKGKLQCIIFLL